MFSMVFRELCNSLIPFTVLHEMYLCLLSWLFAQMVFVNYI